MTDQPKTLRKLTPSWAVMLYFILSIFPGCCCMYLTGIAVAGSGQPYTIVYAILPPLAFALLLLSVSRPSTEDRYDSVAWLCFILAGVSFLCSWHTLYEIRSIIAERSSDNSGETFGMASLSMWLGGIAFGLGILFYGYDFIGRKHKPHPQSRLEHDIPSDKP